MSEKKELRTVSGPVELREEEGKPKIRGYAAVFNVETVIAGCFREVVRPGFFTPAIAEGHDVRAVVDHKGGVQVLGRTKNGTLMLAEDEKGLRVEISPPDTAAGRDITELLRRGDLDQMSFAFTTKEQRWTDGEDGELDLRELLKVKRLYDVSVVTFPAYPETSVGVRSAEETLEDRPAQGYRPGPARLRIEIAEAE